LVGVSGGFGGKASLFGEEQVADDTQGTDNDDSATDGSTIASGRRIRSSLSCRVTDVGTLRSILLDNIIVFSGQDSLAGGRKHSPGFFDPVEVNELVSDLTSGDDLAFRGVWWALEGAESDLGLISELGDRTDSKEVDPDGEHVIDGVPFDIPEIGRFFVRFSFEDDTCGMVDCPHDVVGALVTEGEFFEMEFPLGRGV